MFIVGIFVFIFIFWVISGGPSKPISFAGPYLHPITGPGQTAKPYGISNGSGISIGGSAGGNLSSLEEQIDDLSSLGELSEYRGLVALSRNPSGPRSSDPQTEHVGIALAERAKNPVSITGWRLESSATKVTATIPSGVEVPRSGSVHTVASIVLLPGEVAIITSGRSPIGASFHENICSGYLGEFQEFAPALDKKCPTGVQEYQARFNASPDSACRTYLSDVDQCSAVSRVPSSLSDECKEAATGLNYNACVDRWRGAPGFSDGMWRVFLGKDTELWRDAHETIRLLDGSGKTVDVLAY